MEEKRKTLSLSLSLSGNQGLRVGVLRRVYVHIRPRFVKIESWRAGWTFRRKPRDFLV